MLKSIESLAVGDWVVTESNISHRAIGSPFRVSDIKKSRVYVERYHLDRMTMTEEVSEAQYISLKSIRHVFSDKESAQAASDFSRVLSTECANAVDKLRDACILDFQNYIACLESMAKNSDPLN
jgi:hypothetical protein